MSTLKELLGEELLGQVEAKLGDTKIAIVSDGTWFPKQKFDDLNDAHKTLKDEHEKLETSLKELQGKAGNNEELTKQITEMQDAMEKVKTEAAATVAEKTKEFAIATALRDKSVKSEEAVMPFLKLDTVIVSEGGGEVVGLDEQLTALKERMPFLFAEDEDGRVLGKKSATTGKSSAGKNPWKAGEVDVDEQARIYKEDPDLANSMMEQARG